MVHEDAPVSQLTEQEAEAVRTWLARHQFAHLSTIGGDTAGFGDRQDLWERDGTLVRLTRDRGQWWWDLSRAGAEVWLDVDSVAGAMGSKSGTPVERVADVASVDDRVFGVLSSVLRRPP